MQAMVLTIIGKDEPGLVDAIAKCITDANGNWLKSSFCQLSGQFAGFIEVMLERDKHDELVSACQNLANLHITLLPSSELNNSDSDQSSAELPVVNMTVTANDRRGIVSDIASALKRFNINIIEMSTRCESAPNWGSLLFTAKLSFSLVADVDLDDIKAAVEGITDDLMVEIEGE
ncbi:amino acid-binding protein [Glaciecola sp. MH2013]|uniref:glycine cleavage system protein R n=1 Tax=Glaciecola sp. MH2013 TaxID=2785524 RepID=UPI00189DB927|nr:ACT domain-containing protein [Glaciecola sp. MH2013]MBF7072016.1 amino acid-binding protein [Glaciecola sp. MH2013]